MAEVGLGKISISLTPAKPKAPTSAKAKRPHTSLISADDDHAELEEGNVSSAITGFGPGTEPQKKTSERVIAPIPSRTWRDKNGEANAKRQKSEPKTTKEEESKSINAGEKKYGLQVKRRVTPPPALDAREAEDAGVESDQPQTNGKQPTIEDRAIAALKGEKDIDAEHTIAPVASSLDEDEAFRQDYYSAPLEPTLADYDNTPVDGFGAALLRGYLKPGQSLDAWKEKQESKISKNKKGKAGDGVEKKREGRRPDLLGMGAKELEQNGKDKWKTKAKNVQKDYAPLARVNRKTGEMVTEAELQEKLAAQAETEKYGKLVTENDQQLSKRAERMQLENGERRDRHDKGDGSDDSRRERRKNDRDRHRDRRRNRVDGELDRDHERHRRRREREEESYEEDRRERRHGRHEDSRRDRRHRDRSRDRNRHSR